MNVFDFISIFGLAGGEGESGGDGEDAGAGDGNLPVMPTWAANFPAEITGTEAARNILMKHKDGGDMVEVPTNLVKSYVHAQQKIGGMVSIPADGASKEDVAAFNKRLGVPEAADGYQLKVPEGSPEGFFQDEQLTAFRTDAHELGIPKPKAEELFSRFAGRQVDAYNTYMAGNKQTLQERIDGLKADFGTEYDATIQVADKAVHFADPGMLDVFDKAGLLGHPAIVKGFAKIGKALGEGTLKGVDTRSTVTTLTKQDLEQMMADPKYKLPQGNPVGDAWRKKVEAGFEQLYPGTAGGDINPSSGRALHGA